MIGASFSLDDDTLVEDSASPSSSYHPSIGIILMLRIDWDMLKSRVCRSVPTNYNCADVHQEVLYGPQRCSN